MLPRSINIICSIRKRTEMTKWILCFTAMTSLTVVAAPSKQEATIIQEFTHSIHNELKTEITDFAKQKAENTVRFKVDNATKQDDKQQKKAELIAKVTYSNIKNAE
jgi:uncharacterized UPF0146 family protein